MNATPDDEDARSEVKRLEEFIAASSRQAEQAITERFRERTGEQTGERTNGDRPSS